MAFPAYGTSAPSLANWQISFAGLTMGGGVNAYGISEIQGLDAPAILGGDLSRPREHGDFIGLDVYAGRDIVIAGDVTTDGTSLASALKTLAAATITTGNTETPLWVQLPGLPLLSTLCRPRKRSIPVGISWSGGLAPMALAFHSTDPRLYGVALQTSGGLGAHGSGLHPPITFPAAFGGGSSATVLTITNAGNVETRPILVLTGPVTNPVIYNATTGWQISISNPTQTGYTLNAGDTLVIDTDTHAVTYTASGTTVGSTRQNWIVAGSTWPSYVGQVAGLTPGANLVQFTSADAGDVAGTLAVQYAPAYLI